MKFGRQRGSIVHLSLRVFYLVSEDQIQEESQSEGPSQCSGHSHSGSLDLFWVLSPSFRVFLFPKVHTCKSSLEASPQATEPVNLLGGKASSSST